MMTPEEILHKAIEKAIAGGWHNYGHAAGAFAIGKDPLRIEYSHGSSLHLYGLLYDKEWAKALWGEASEVKYHKHDCHVNDADYVDDTPQPNTYAQRLQHYKKDYTCRRCKSYLKMLHNIINSNCLPIEGTEYNVGWRHHVQKMVIAIDPIQYLGDNLPA